MLVHPLPGLHQTHARHPLRCPTIEGVVPNYGEIGHACHERSTSHALSTPLQTRRASHTAVDRTPYAAPGAPLSAMRVMKQLSVFRGLSMRFPLTSF